jgi:hypothetical protein
MSSVPDRTGLLRETLIFDGKRQRFALLANVDVFRKRRFWTGRENGEEKRRKAAGGVKAGKATRPSHDSLCGRPRCPRRVAV